jgi:anti-sigma regulatory factor (Ser/Thr protein kinase)
VQKIQPLSTLSTEQQSSVIKQRVINVIRSYHNAADVLAEPVQNAVDEVLAADGLTGPGEVTVVMNTDRNRLSVIDNGRGISRADIERYLAPDTGTKMPQFRNGWVRGHKGVGMTFLVYGFDYFELESRTLEGEHYRVRLEGGRTWVADEAMELEPPVGELEFLEGEGNLATHGTIVTVGLDPRTTPRELKRAFPTVEFAAVALQNQSAIGIVEPPQIRKKRDLIARLKYISDDKTQERVVDSSFRHPHSHLDNTVKVLDLDEWFRKSRRTEPTPREREAYHACHATFGPEQLKGLVADREGQTLTTSQEVYKYIDDHKVHVYALFSYSASYRDMLADNWKVPKNRALHAPRLRVATDGMISSWSREITLTHRGFNVDRTWLTYQLHGVEPDMGRKDFPPDLHDFLQISEERVANEIARLSKPFLRIAPRPSQPTNGSYVEPAVKAYERLKKPLVPARIPDIGEISFRTIPESENDVISLFSELVGLGVLRHLKPVFFSGFDYYDSFFEYVPSDVDPRVKERLPGETEIDRRDSSGVAEFKFQGASLLDDIVSEKKRWEDMRFLVCWTTGKESVQKAGDEITFQQVGSPVDRRFHGVTHLARLKTGGARTIFVISLSDLLNTLASEG